MVEFKQELKLAQQMKDCCCDASGKETEPAKAAEIIHKIAVIYRKRSPIAKKVSLIAKRKILQQGGFLPLILSALAPLVEKILGELTQ